MEESTIVFEGRGGVVVTDSYLRTRTRDQALDPISRVHVDRTPFHIGAAMGIGLILFALAFGDLLYLHEHVGFVLLAIAVSAAGYSVGILQLGSYAHERTALVSDIWTVRQVRDAIIRVKRAHRSSPEHSIAVIPE